MASAARIPSLNCPTDARDILPRIPNNLFPVITRFICFKEIFLTLEFISKNVRDAIAKPSVWEARLSVVHISVHAHGNLLKQVKNAYQTACTALREGLPLPKVFTGLVATHGDALVRYSQFLKVVKASTVHFTPDHLPGLIAYQGGGDWLADVVEMLIPHVKAKGEGILNVSLRTAAGLGYGQIVDRLLTHSQPPVDSDNLFSSQLSHDISCFGFSDAFLDACSKSSCTLEMVRIFSSHLHKYQINPSFLCSSISIALGRANVPLVLALIPLIDRFETREVHLLLHRISKQELGLLLRCGAYLGNLACVQLILSVQFEGKIESDDLAAALCLTLHGRHYSLVNPLVEAIAKREPKPQTSELTAVT